MAKAVSKKTTKRNKPVTLAEFKAWLEGVEELQPDGWAPDAHQWELIRNKINSIIEPEPEVIYETKHVEVPNSGMTPYRPAPEYVPSTLPEMPEILPGPPVKETALPMNVDMTPAAKAALSGGPIPGTPGPSGKVKTPNIDTSNGNYQTSFE